MHVLKVVDVLFEDWNVECSLQQIAKEYAIYEGARFF